MSWQAKLLNKVVQLVIRRQKWGKNEIALAKRARFIFGSPFLLQWLGTRGLTISPFAENSLKGEWLKPSKPQNGVILYMHGGGYVSCSPATHRPITGSLAHLSKNPVLSIDYRLAPEHRFPGASEDVFAAYKWLIDEGTPAKNIAIAGDSAGGGLVLSLLLRAKNEGVDLPACAVCFSAWTDLAATGQSIKTNDGRCDMFHPQNIFDFASAYLNNQSSSNVYASPIYGDLKDLPPILFQVSSTELLLDDSRRVHEIIQRNNGVSKLEIYDDIFHCWQMLANIVPEADDALKRAATFINQHINN